MLFHQAIFNIHKMHMLQSAVTCLCFMICINISYGAVMSLMDSIHIYKVHFDNTTFDRLFACLVSNRTESCQVDLNKTEPHEYNATDVKQTTYSSRKIPKFALYHCYLQNDTTSDLVFCLRSSKKPYNQSACLPYGFIIKWLEDQEYFADDYSLLNCSVGASQIAYSRPDRPNLLDLLPTVGATNLTVAAANETVTSANETVTLANVTVASTNERNVSANKTVASTDKNKVMMMAALISTSTLLIIAVVAIMGLFVAQHNNTSVVHILCPKRLIKLIHSTKKQPSVNVYDSTDMYHLDDHCYNDIDEKDREYNVYCEIVDSKSNLHLDYLQIL